jgi:hypothetical protein
MASPPFDAGAVQATATCVSPRVAAPIVGAPGSVAGVTDADVPARPVPPALIAATWNVYAVPFVKPVTMKLGDVDPVRIAVCAVAPMNGVTEYPVIAVPPFDTGAVHVNDTWVLPRVGVTPVGAPGTRFGVADADDADAGPVPTVFVAVTVNVYAVPFTRPLTVHVSAGAVARQVFGPAMPPAEVTV